jgi:cytosolic carboxypeptidase protein 2/3
VSIPLITITDFKYSTKKTTVVINGRVHPGETNASWALHGFIRFLLSKSPQAK